MKKIQINLSNKVFYTLVSIAFVIVLGVGVSAVWANPTTGVGHSLDELAPCGAGQFLNYDGTKWACASGNLLSQSCSEGQVMVRGTGYPYGNWKCADYDGSQWIVVGDNIHRTVGYVNIKKLGIGGNPSYPLHVRGKAVFEDEVIIKKIDSDLRVEGSFGVYGNVIKLPKHDHEPYFCAESHAGEMYFDSANLYNHQSLCTCSYTSTYFDSNMGWKWVTFFRYGGDKSAIVVECD
ncbi:hypothetical protein J4481_01130 [Candidatus Pacearchaeota archaeon]|nr:hypothetical protein [Candidatus Pacearchaeota archaeon]